MTRLSNSSSTKFQTCPEAWNLHYNKKYRSRLQSSALSFGSAIDLAFGAALTGKDAHDMFDKAWSHQEINKSVVYLTDSPLMSYYESDLCLWILDKSDHDTLNAWLRSNTPETRNWNEVFDEICELKRDIGLKNISEMKCRFYNHVFWLSCKKRGHLMVQALIDKIVPRITSVIALQKEINIKLDNGSVTGFIDMICQWSGSENDIVVFDLKTAGRVYEEDSVKKSHQLALYMKAVGKEYQTRKAGYIVVLKKLIENKTKVCEKCNQVGTGSRARTCDKEIDGTRCMGAWIEGRSPEVAIQVLVDDIPQSFEDLVVENMDMINKAIESGIFIKNLDSCIQKWGPCPFYNLCHSGSSDDLIRMEETQNA